METVQDEGGRSVRRTIDFYNPTMGLTAWKGAPDGKILKSDVLIKSNRKIHRIGKEEPADLPAGSSSCHSANTLHNSTKHVVEPDISVICDRNKLDAHGCKGAPDMVIEILSPSNRRHDRLVKLDLYQRAGVREYWIVSPEAQTVEVFLLEDGRFIVQGFYEKNDIAKVHALEGCFVELCKVFAE